jgi:hypothetical protein
MAVFYIAMKTRPWPIDHAIYQLVFNRIEVDVVYVMIEVVLISNTMLPESSLPYWRFVSFLSRIVDRNIRRYYLEI